MDIPMREFRQPWYRFARLHHSPIYWGLQPPRTSGTEGRFDAPNGEYGVLYLGADVHCAFIETFGHETGIDVVETAELLARPLYRVEVDRPLRLLTLTRNHLAQVRADAQLLSGDTDVARQWSLAIYEHPMSPDGIFYHARHDPGRMALALFDRGGMEEHLRVTCLGTLLDPDNRHLLGYLLNSYKFGLT